MSTPSRAIRRSPNDFSLAGYWQVLVRKAGSPLQDVTAVRGVPVSLGEITFEDPGGPKDVSLTFANVTIFDKMGYGDLGWMSKHTTLDVRWVPATSLPATYPFGTYTGPPASKVWVPSFRWEGFLDAPTYQGKDGTTWQGKGQIYQLDNYLAKPEYWSRPLPYETAIARCFLERPHLRMPPMHIWWPDWWDTVYTPPPKNTPKYLIPAGIQAGKNWTAMRTRDSGHWDPVFSSYITTLLTGLYTVRGRFTLDLMAGRIPVLLHRDIKDTADSATFILDPVDDGVDISGLSQDWSQTYDVAYAQGTSLTGVGYTGMQVSNDGQRTGYEPAAYRRQAFPDEPENEWLDLSLMPRETVLQMPAGIDELAARGVARATLQRFANPGVVGDIVLSSDVRINDGGGSDGKGSVVPFQLVRAGASVVLPGLFGSPEGVVAHITRSRHDLPGGKNTITVDSKYRDALTTEEVKLRGRDAMNIQRMLVGGQYNPPLPDQLYPWNYAEGSGMLPGGKHNNALDLFDGMPDSVMFPWDSWTQAHPPSKSRWRHCYAHIPPASGTDATLNWAHNPGERGGRYALPIRMAQAGQIRLIQIAAYHADGTVFPIPFHVSFYYFHGVNVRSMPLIPAGGGYPPYSAGQPYPWVAGAFEQYNADGTLKSTDIPDPLQSAGLWVAFGVGTGPKAGYFPGDGSGVSPTPTGLFVDETVRTFDTASYNQFDPRSPKGNLKNTFAGHMYAMIYCDAQSTADVYFLGRMFRVEPGSTPGG